MMGKLLDSVLSVLFPKRCPCCGKITGVSEPCESCFESLTAVRVKGTTCKKCGEPIVECHCRGFNPLYKAVVAPFKRDGAARDGIYALKFHAKFYAAEYFGTEMAKEFKRRYPDVQVDVVCGVPSTAKELKDKSCDQVALLAKYVVENLQVPFSEKLILKVRETKRQRELKHDERAANVKDAFKVMEDLSGKTVLLIDDIKTTGYTLNECAKQLRLQGAKDVFCLTALVTSFSSCKDREDDI